MADQTSQTPAAGREPMIRQDQRPTPIDYNAPVSSLTVSEFLTLQANEIHKVEKEIHKEYLKPEKEIFKVEKEFYKPEKEFSKPEKEYFKPELLKPELLKPELLKPEGKPDPTNQQLVEQVAARVVEILRQQGVIPQS